MTDMIEQIAQALAPFLEGGREFDQMPNGEEAKRAWYRANMCGLNDATKEDAIEAAQAILPLIEARVLAERERCAGVAEWRNPSSAEYQRGRSDAAKAIREVQP